MSGWTAMPFGVFVMSSFVARSLRFFMVATLLYYYGASIRGFIETRLSLVFTLFVIILGAGFFIIRFMWGSNYKTISFQSHTTSANSCIWISIITCNCLRIWGFRLCALSNVFMAKISAWICCFGWYCYFNYAQTRINRTRRFYLLYHSRNWIISFWRWTKTVSYTHLTLPTILRV